MSKSNTTKRDGYAEIIDRIIAELQQGTTSAMGKTEDSSRQQHAAQRAVWPRVQRRERLAVLGRAQAVA